MKVGQKVVCIDDHAFAVTGVTTPLRGQIYTIREIDPVSGCVRLCEIVLPHAAGVEEGSFRADRFADNLEALGDDMPVTFAVRGPVALTAPPDSATTAWIAAVVTAGGSVGATQQGRVNTLIAGLKADGSFTLLDRLWLYAGESSAQQASIDIITAGNAHSLVNAPTLSASGYTGDGTTSYINTNFNPVTAAGLFSQNSASMGFYAQSRVSSHDWSAMGTSDGNAQTRLSPFNSTFSGNLAFNIQSSTGALVHNFNQTDAKGAYTATRTGATASAIYMNSSSTAVDTDATASGALDSQNVFVCAYNSTGTPTGFSGDTISATWIGGALTGAQAVNIMTRINTYMTAWGINVY